MSATDALDAYLANATNPSLPPPGQFTASASPRNTALADDDIAPRNHAVPQPWTSEHTEIARPRGVETNSSAAMPATGGSEVRSSAHARATAGRVVNVKPAGTSKPQQGRAAALKLGTSKPRAAPLPRVAMLGKLAPEPRPSVRTVGTTSYSKAKPSGMSVAGAWPPPAGTMTRGKTLAGTCDQQGAATSAGSSLPSMSPAVGLPEEGGGARASNKMGNNLSPTAVSIARQNPMPFGESISTGGHVPQGNMLGSPGPAPAVRYATSTGGHLPKSPQAVLRQDWAEPQELLPRPCLQVQGLPLVDSAAEPHELAQNPLEGFGLGDQADEGSGQNPDIGALDGGGTDLPDKPLSQGLRRKPGPHQHGEAASELANPFLWVPPAQAEWKPSGDDNAATSHQVHILRHQGPSDRRDLDRTEWDPLANLRGKGLGVANPSRVCAMTGWPSGGLKGRANPAASAAGGDGLRQVAEGLLGERPRQEPYEDGHTESRMQLGGQGSALGGGGFSALDHSIASALWMALQPEEWPRGPGGGTGPKRARRETARGAHVTADWATLAIMPDAPTLHREPSWAASTGPSSPAVPIFDLNHPQIPTPPRLYPQLYGPRASAGPPAGLFSDEGPPRLAERRHAGGGPPRIPRSPCGRETTSGRRLDVGEAVPLSDVSRQLRDLRLQWHTFCDAHLNYTPHLIYTPHISYNPRHIPSHAPSHTSLQNTKPQHLAPQPARLLSSSLRHVRVTACASDAENPASPPLAPNRQSKPPKPVPRRALGFRLAPIRVRPSRVPAVALPAVKPHPATGQNRGRTPTGKCTCSIASSGVQTSGPQAPDSLNTSQRMGATAGPSVEVPKDKSQRRSVRPSVEGKGRALATPPLTTEAVTRGRARALAVPRLAPSAMSERNLPAGETGGHRATGRRGAADGRTSTREVMEQGRCRGYAGPVGRRAGCKWSCSGIEASSPRQRNTPVTCDAAVKPGERADVQGSGVQPRVCRAREGGQGQRLHARPCPLLRRVGQTLSPGYKPMRKGYTVGGKLPLSEMRRGVPPLGEYRGREIFPCPLSDESSGSSGQTEGEDCSETSSGGSETERSSLTDDTSTSMAAAVHQAAHHRHLSRQNLGRTRYSWHRVPSLSWCASSGQHAMVHQRGFQHAKHAPAKAPDVHRPTRQSCATLARAPSGQTPVAWGTPGMSASHGSQLAPGLWQTWGRVARKPARMCDKQGALPHCQGRELSLAWGLDLQGAGQCPVQTAERSGHPWFGIDGAACHIMAEEGQPALLRCSSAEAGLASDMRSEGDPEAGENGAGDLAHDFLPEGNSPIPRACSRAEAGRGSDERNRQPGEGCDRTGDLPFYDARARESAVPWGSDNAMAGGESDGQERVFAAAWGADSLRGDGESDVLACASVEAQGSDQHPAPATGAELAGPWLTCGDANRMSTSNFCHLQADSMSGELGHTNSEPACTMDPGNCCEDASHFPLTCGDGSSACPVDCQDLTAQETHPHVGRDDANSAARPLLIQDLPGSRHSPMPKRHRPMPCPPQGAESALFGAAAIRARYPALFAQSGIEALTEGSPGTHVAAGEGSCAVASEDGPQPLLWGNLDSIPARAAEGLAAVGSGNDSGETPQGPHVSSGGSCPEVGGDTGSQSFGLPIGSADPTRVEAFVPPFEIATDVGSGGDLGNLGLVGDMTKGHTSGGSLQTTGSWCVQ